MQLVDLNMPALKFVFVLVIFVVLEEASAKYYHSIGGPFKVNLKYIEKCPGENGNANLAEYSYQIRRRRGQPTAYSGNVSVPFTMDDSIVVKFNLASWSNNGGWKPNAYLATIREPCKMATTHLEPQIKYAMNNFFGERLYCPFYPGLYRVNNLTFPDHLLKSSRIIIRHFVYGRWRFEMRLYTKDGDMAACGRAYVETLPR